MTLTETILQLAARDGGAMTADLTALGHTQRAVSAAAYALRKAGKVLSFKCSNGAHYHTDEAAHIKAQAAWAADVKLRKSILNRKKHEKRKLSPEWNEKRNKRLADYRAKKREEDIAAGLAVRKLPKKQPRDYKVTPKQKPAFPATVTIKSSARGPAYLPGEPRFTASTKYTYGVSPTNPTRTNTHAE